MAEKIELVQDTTTPTDSERISSALDTALQQRESAAVAAFASELSEKLAPREESRIPVTAEREDDAGEGRPYGAVTTRVATHPLYARLSEAEQKWRSPESDHWCQRWMYGLAHKREDIMLEAHAKVEALYGRATWDVGTPDAGGGIAGGGGAHTVPTPLLNVVMINRDQVAKIPGLSTNFQLTATQARIPQVGAATVEMIAEGVAQTGDGNPPQTSVLPRANKMRGRAVVTEEQLNDSAFNSVSLIAQRMGTKMGETEDIQACTSNGTAPNIQHTIKEGITVADGVAAPLTFAQVVALYFAVKQQYRMNAVWYVDSVAAEILTKINGDNGYPIFSTQAAVPGAITDDSADGVMFRKPVYEVPLAASTGSGIILFKARETYGWGRRSGMQASASEHVLFDSDTWVYKFVQRVEGVQLDPTTGHGSGRENIT